MNFIEEYKTYTKGNEVAPIFHEWGALSTLAAVVGKKIATKMGYFDVFPNMYVVFVAPPGSRKSTAIATVKELIKHFTDIKLCSDSLSRESLIGDMVANPRVITDPFNPIEEITTSPVFVCVGEMSELLGPSQQNMVSFLTAIYDERKFVYSTIRRGTEIIPDPCLNLLGCTTPDFMTANLRTDIISGGFSRRAVFVFTPDRAARVPLPMITPEMVEAKKKMLQRLEFLHSTIKGAFEWTKEGLDWYSQWYTSLAIPENPNTRGWWESRHIQLIKVAMLCCIAEQNELYLDVKYLTQADVILKKVEEHLNEVFEGVGRNPLNGVRKIIIDLLRAANDHTLPANVIRKLTFTNATTQELDAVLAHMVSCQELLLIPSTKPKYKLILKK